MIKVIVIDDSELVHKALGEQLKNIDGVERVAYGHDGTELLPLYEEHDPDVVITDLHMSASGSGIVALMQLFEKYPSARVVVLSSHIHALHYKVLRSLNVLGYLKKVASIEVLSEAIHLAYEKKPYYCKEATSLLIEEHKSNLFKKLTHQESIVISQLIHYNCTLKDVARFLGVGYETVKSHKQSAFGKLKISTRKDLMVLALKHGFYIGYH